MYRGHYKHDRTLLNAINKASSGTARRSRNGSEALRPTVWWHVEDKHHRDLEKRVFIKYGEIHLKLPTLWILLVSKKNLKKKTGNYMHGSTVPCPILCMCLLSSLLMFGSASLFIIKNWGHVSSMKSVKNKENHSRGELLMLGSSIYLKRYHESGFCRTVCYSELVISFSTFLPYSMIASSSFIQQTFLAIYI
jgi:hypothetical protein